MPDHGHTADEDDMSTGRLISLSDAIFGFSITLSVLGIDLPDNLSASDLPRQLGALWPHLLTYGLNYFVVASYWVAHHRIFRPVRRHDAGLMWLNNLFLLTITFIPFLSKLIGEYGGVQIAVVIYAGCMAVSGLLLTVVAWYVRRDQRFMERDVNLRQLQRTTIQGLVVPVVFLISIGISFVSPSAAMYSWFLVMPLQPLVRRAWQHRQTG
jgi:TMEM175 potassium channel family protein